MLLHVSTQDKVDSKGPQNISVFCTHVLRIVQGGVVGEQGISLADMAHFQWAHIIVQNGQG